MTDPGSLFRRTFALLCAFGFMLGCVLLGLDAMLRDMGGPGLFPLGL